MASRSYGIRTKKPTAPAADPQSMFAVLKMVGGSGGGSEKGEATPLRVYVRGLHTTEEQAYTAAIVELIYDNENSEEAPLPKLRAIAKSDTLPLKDRLKSLQGCQGPEERVEFLIKKSTAFPEEEKLKDIDAVLEAPLLPFSYWDSSDEEDYEPDEEEGEEDDEEDDDDMEDLVNEDEAMQGIEGSGVKDEGEGKAQEDEEAEEEKKAE